jgi:hypothetical protein
VQGLTPAALQRKPTERELDLGRTFLRDSMAEGKVPLREAVTDMLWAIVTSPTFQYVN